MGKYDVLLIIGAVLWFIFVFVMSNRRIKKYKGFLGDYIDKLNKLDKLDKLDELIEEVKKLNRGK